MARSLVLRVGRSAVAWKGTPQLAMESEFHPRLRPSVYLVDVPDDLTSRQVALRVTVEHLASSMFEPPPKAFSVDLAGYAPMGVSEMLATQLFLFIGAAHRCLEFTTGESDLLSMIGKVQVDSRIPVDNGVR